MIEPPLQARAALDASAYGAFEIASRPFETVIEKPLCNPVFRRPDARDAAISRVQRAQVQPCAVEPDTAGDDPLAQRVKYLAVGAKKPPLAQQPVCQTPAELGGCFGQRSERQRWAPSIEGTVPRFGAGISAVVEGGARLPGPSALSWRLTSNCTAGF